MDYLEDNVYNKLKLIVWKYKQTLSDPAKPLFDERVLTAECMELEENGYITSEKGEKDYNGKMQEVIYYKPTIKGFMRIDKYTPVPAELGGGNEPIQIRFSGYTQPFCEKYLYDEDWKGEAGSIKGLYHDFFQIIKSKPFYKADDPELFRKLNKELINTNISGLTTQRRWEQILFKINSRVDRNEYEEPKKLVKKTFIKYDADDWSVDFLK